MLNNENNKIKKALARIRIKLIIVFVMVLLYIPVGMVILEFEVFNDQDYYAYYSLFWFLITFIIWTSYCFSRCPQCGKFFFFKILGWPLARECVHCGLHIKADKGVEK